MKITIKDTIDFDEIARIMLLTEDHGKQVLIYINGKIETIGANETLHEDDYKGCIAILETPGIGNIDTSVFGEDFVTWDDDQNAYITIDPQPDPGRVVGQMEDVIRECIEDGDMTRYTDEWEAEIIRQFRETKMK